MAVVIPAAAAMKQVTVTVRITGVRVLAARVRVACWLMTLAAWIAGCGIRVER